MLLMLVFYIHLVSTSPSQDSALQNLTMHLKKFLDNIDPTLVFGGTHSHVMEALGTTTVSPFLNRPIAPKISRRQGKGRKAKTTTTKAESPFNKNKRLKKKIFDMMQQFLFAGQELLWPVEPVLERYQSMSPFRMAFIFGQLEQLSREANSIMSYMEIQAKKPKSELSVTQRLQIYWNLMIKNVDVTYLVDYIKEHAPNDQSSSLSLRVLQKEKENIEKMMQARTVGRRLYGN